MRTEARSKRWIIWIISIAAVLTVAVTIGLQYLKKDIKSPVSRVEKAIEKKVEKNAPNIVKEASDSLYDIRYSNIDVDIDKGYAVINNLQLTPNKGISTKLLSEHKLPNNIVQLKADKVVVKGIGLKKIQGELAMHVANLTVVNPLITINNKVRAHRDTTERKSWLAQLSKKLFSSVDFDAIVDMRIDNTALNNATIIYVNHNGAKARTTRLKNLDFIITNVSTDGLANKGNKGNAPAIASIEHQRIVTADKLYYIDLRNIRIVPNENKITIGTFELLPSLDKTEFVKAVKAGRANYRYHLKNTGIVMKNIDLEKFARKQQFHIPEVTIDYAWAEYYTNYNWPLRTPPNRRDKYPHEQLQKLAFDITIDKMKVKNGDNYFRIITESTGKQAEFSMNNISSVYTNVTNNASAKKKNPYTTIISNYKVMNAGQMQSKYKLNLNDPNGAYTISSTLGPMDGTAYNPLIEPLALMQVKSLKINKMQMDLNVDEYKAKGNIDFYYNDYKVRLLKERNDKLKNRTLISFVSNAILPNDNPKKNGEFRKGPINIVRDPRESFFGFQWRAMLDGLSSAMTGADQDKEKPQNKVTRMAKLFYGPDKGQEHKSTGKDKKLMNKNADKKSD